MCWRFGLLLLVLLQVCGFGSSRVHKRHLPGHSGNEIVAVEREHELVLECQHPDYRTYIKCLKRDKRADQNGVSGSCMDECINQNCTDSACIRDCHWRCKKRIIETHSKTVETSYDCKNDDCTPVNSLPNITTNIHIDNIMPNITEKGCRQDCKDECKDNNCSDDKKSLPDININNVINNQLDSSSARDQCPCPGCNCFPQITIGIGGGCMFPSWPCYSSYPRYPAQGADCSICNNPFLRLQCDPSCIPNSPRNNTPATTPRASVMPQGSRSYKS